MAKESVDALIEGGKASAAPPLGPALGPLKVNIGAVVKEINDKTQALKGMQVPIKVIVDTDTKEFEIEIGTPPAAALIIKEAGVQKGSGNPLLDKVADLKIEQIMSIAKTKSDSLLGKNLKEQVREIIGTCQSMGVLVEGMTAPDALKAISEGKYDEKILSGKTELTPEELKKLEEEKARLKKEADARREKLKGLAKEIIAKNKNAKGNKIKAIMVDEKIPPDLIEETMTAAGITLEGKKK